MVFQNSIYGACLNDIHEDLIYINGKWISLKDIKKQENDSVIYIDTDSIKQKKRSDYK